MPFLAVLVPLLGGFAPPMIGVVLLALVLLLGWLTYLTWPRLPQGGRLVRRAVLALLVFTIARRATKG
jgi:hypothetical protein